jgi:Fe-S cluster biogenesis protein NfuA
MTDKTDEEITQEINDLLEIHVAPMVAQHGGSVTLESYKDGVATMFMSGACAGCASSNATIKYGVQNMLTHFIPEVQLVESIEDQDSGVQPYYPTGM